MNIQQKQDILKTSIQCLQYMTFDDERGIILDELPMLLYNSNLEGSFLQNKSGI